MARIRLKMLARLCRRLSTSLAAGIDLRKIWQREATNASGVAKSRFDSILLNVNQGSSLAEAVGQCGDYFPELFRSMVNVGEKSGHLPEVLRQLADQYDHQLKLRRTFIGAIWWPLLQLSLAITIVGFLIWIMGIIAPPTKPGAPPPIDPLGFGLIGKEGLTIYLLIVGGVTVLVALLVRAVWRGALWIRPVQKLVFRIPAIGQAFQTIALARLAWLLHTTLGAGMSLKEAIKLSLESTRNVEIAETADQVWGEIRRGSDLHDALAATGKFPPHFLDVIEVGEQTGNLVESLEKLAQQYEEFSRTALEVLTKILGFLVWGLVACLIIVIIFRLFSFYIGAINDLSNGL